MMEEVALSPAIACRGVLCQVQRHRELADLAFKRCNMRLVFGNNARRRFLTIQLAAIELREP